MTAKIHFDKTLIAHRGASAYAPENTIAALQKAVALKAKWIEFDVMLSRDKTAIIMHDTLLRRTTDGRGFVARKNYAELLSLDAGSWFSRHYAGEKIPSFVEYLKFCADHNLCINVEIKPTRGKERQTATVVVDLLAKHWPSRLPLLVSSGYFTCLTTAHHLNPSLKLGYVVDRWYRRLPSQLKKLPLFSVNANHKLLNEKRISFLQSQGLVVLAYTVNQAALAQGLFANGVSGIFTDYPDLLTR